MGLFNFFSGDKKKKQGILFATSLDIEKNLFRLGTLNQEQRSLVKEVVARFAGSGGVTVEEYRVRILPELYKLLKNGKISSVDYQKLKNLIYQ